MVGLAHLRSPLMWLYTASDIARTNANASSKADARYSEIWSMANANPINAPGVAYGSPHF